MKTDREMFILETSKVAKRMATVLTFGKMTEFMKVTSDQASDMDKEL